MKDYPFKARFAAFARAMPNFENQKQVATAALSDLANVFKGEEIQARIMANPDLLFWASNLALLDHANLNDDALRKEDGLRIYKNFILKLLDIEHNRSDVIGAIYDAGFSIFPSNRIISYEEAIATNDVIQLVVGGYIWRIVAGELCGLIEQASLETSTSYGDVSTSFELAFDDYEIGIGEKGNRSVKDATIINKNDPAFASFNKMLRVNGGKGKTPGGDLVFRILGGDILPLGAGVVGKPASGLKGILHVNQVVPANADDIKALSSVGDIAIKESIESIQTAVEGFSKEGLAAKDVTDRLEEINKVFEVSAKDIADALERIGATAQDAGVSFDELTAAITKAVKETGRSGAVIGNAIKTILVRGERGLFQASLAAELNIKSEESSVTNNTTTLLPMKIKSLDELADKWADVKKLETVASVVTDLKEVATAATRKEIEERLAVESEKFAAELKTQKDLVQQVEANKLSAEKLAGELQTTVSALQKELSELKAAQVAKANEDAFDKRMAALNEEFELDDEDLAFIVDEVKSIPDDEAFAKYMTKQKKLLASKKKKAKAEFPFKKEGDDKKEVKPGEKKEGKCEAGVDVKEVVASVTEKPNQSLPNTVVPAENLADKVRKIMGDSVTVNNVKMSEAKK